MIKAIALALWCATAGLSASYGAAYWQAHKTEDANNGHEKPIIEQRKTRIISVPMIVESKLQGYIVAQFAYSVDVTAMKSVPGSTDNYMLDEAFRIIYADDKYDFRHFTKFDMDALAKDLQQRVNKRMSVDAVKEILVHEFNYVPRDMVRQ